ncbi:MAG TPA: carboxypeptidase regulatory-like domain-containing protein [Candidatus Acidoferrales bacterium]|nr:carboxypeptidase regulatory-like domain-containing protein [Candidatus Acidoferrales bacterium]
MALSRGMDKGSHYFSCLKSFCSPLTRTRLAHLSMALGLICCFSMIARADTVGSISGTVTDQSGAVIPDATVTALNLDTTVQQTTKTNANGFYNFTALPVGRYEIEIVREGFEPYKRTGLVVDVNSQLRADITLSMGGQSEEVVVSATSMQVETQSTQMGDVETGQVITAVALNGRSFTDLLSLQPSIVPMSTQTNDSVVMAGVTVAITPSGNLNAGNQSINGQREDANGFLVNGSDVKELMNGGTAIIPDLDSIAEFRVLTNNFDAEYGNYAGGIVNVVTQSGTDQIHGDVFEFLRNTFLDAKDFFATQRDTYQQNQFGGTLGGPIKKEKVFFFGDYQGTRTVEGLETGLLNVPSAAEQQGNFADTAIPGLVQGAGLAVQLQNSLGYPVSSGEPYFTPGCTSATCVFPNAIIPKSAWTVPAQHLLQYIPLPNDGPNTFSGTGDERLRDDKASFRVDTNSMRWGNFSVYYFFDAYYVSNPFPSGQGGASIPGFNGINYGRSQLISLSNTKTFGTSWVNEAHFSFMRSHNVVGQPSGGLGVRLASQGFNTNPTQGGILPLAPQFEGVENTVLQGDFVMGVPITNVNQANNTFSLNEGLSRVLGNHTIKGGFEVSFEQVNVIPDAIFDGTFIFDGYQTGNNYADFLIGAPNQFNQQDSASYYPRHKYAGWYGQDSWRIKSNLTFNYGLRVDLMQYWSEKYDQVPTLNPGKQSKVYPNAFPGLVYPTDPGIPNTLVPEKFRYAPRFGLAYSPSKRGGLLGKILGGPGSSSIRAGYGIMNTVIEGNTLGIDEPQPPYGLSGTVFNGLFAAPYNLADGTIEASPYPLTFPPLNATASHPNSIPFNNIYNPQSGMTAPPPWNTYPYTEDYFLSFERQLPGQTVLSISYAGSEGHHLLLVYSANPGNPALCMALNRPGILTPGESCGPGGENTNYNLAQLFTFGGVTYPAGTVLQGTRFGLNPNLINKNVSAGNYFGNDDYDSSIGNSNYNALQVTVRSSIKDLTYSLSYTYSKSIDQASSISDAVDPYNFNFTRALSAWNLKHNFVATYDYRLPLQRLAHRFRRALEGWEISGVTRAASGFPVTLSTNGDNSLQGSSPNGVNNRYLDLPAFAGQSLKINSNPRANGLQYFNPGAFTSNAIGTPGNVARRFFSGPGMFNTDAVLRRNFQIREGKVLQLRLEVFNLFNHVQFFGPAAVNGDVDNTQLFGKVQNSAAPRLMQLAAKFTF